MIIDTELISSSPLFHHIEADGFALLGVISLVSKTISPSSVPYDHFDCPRPSDALPGLPMPSCCHAPKWFQRASPVLSSPEGCGANFRKMFHGFVPLSEHRSKGLAIAGVFRRALVLLCLRSGLAKSGSSPAPLIGSCSRGFREPPGSL